MFWSLLLTLGLVFLTGRRAVFRQALRERKNLVTFTVTGLLLAVNWLLYIWAVNAGFIVEASLGYFINPLINVFFGMIFFREKMRPVQWLALLLAFLGVLYLTFYYGRFPWIALVLAISFAIYGLLHKKNDLGALDGLCLETGVMFLPAAARSHRACLFRQRIFRDNRIFRVIAAGGDRSCHNSTIASFWLCRQEDSAVHSRSDAVSGSDDQSRARCFCLWRRISAGTDGRIYAYLDCSGDIYG